MLRCKSDSAFSLSTKATPFPLAPQDRKLHVTSAFLKKEKSAKTRLGERIVAMREEAIQVPREQGDALHSLLKDPYTSEIFDNKLRPGSDERQFYLVRYPILRSFAFRELSEHKFCWTRGDLMVFGGQGSCPCGLGLDGCTFSVSLCSM